MKVNTVIIVRVLIIHPLRADSKQFALNALVSIKPEIAIFLIKRIFKAQTILATIPPTTINVFKNLKILKLTEL